MSAAQPCLMFSDHGRAVAVLTDLKGVSPFAAAADINRIVGDAAAMLVEH